MATRRDFISGVLTAAVAATVPRFLPEKWVVLPTIPVGFSSLIENKSMWLIKEIEIPEGDVILLDGTDTVQRPEKMNLLPGGMAAYCKTDKNAYAFWGTGITI